ncbi:MAG: hypothetical protein H5T86_15745, partial [Armatimonadetes bacterium]|nr:hypothetical protein [Armatimonadota bacterium]
LEDISAQGPAGDLLEPGAGQVPPVRCRYGTAMGSAIGFGIGMVFALGGFWAGVICILFAVAGAVVGRIFLEG